jgi:hypothetical protein
MVDIKPYAKTIIAPSGVSHFKLVNPFPELTNSAEGRMANFSQFRK